VNAARNGWSEGPVAPYLVLGEDFAMKRWLKRLLVLILVLLGGGLALAWTPDADPQELAARYAGSASRFVDLGGGLRVHVRDEGPRDAPAIVLLHGSNASLHTWNAWTRRLARRYRVISYDQPGHGLTGPHPRGDYRASAFVDVLDRVTRALGAERFVLAGNSMGGWVAWNYALAHPDRLTGLVLVDAAGAPGSAPKKLPIGFRIANSPAAPLMEHLTPRWVVARSVEQSMFVQDAITPVMIDRYWDLLRYPGNRKATRDRAVTPRTTASADSMARIKVPTLVLWGAEDTLIPVASAHWFARNIPGARLVVLPRVGHIPMEEAPEQSVDALAGWMASRT
jgi:pimeloyl-ACP methyl ester carboxylesterase